MMQIVTTPRLSADHDDIWWTLDPEQRQQLIDWLIRHGFDECAVTAVEIDVMDCPLLRVTMFAKPWRRTEDGADLLSETVERAIVEPAPEWWVAA